MNVFERSALIVIIASLCACSGSRNAALLPSGNAAGSARPLIVTVADLKRVVAWGSKGQVAVAQCPQGDKVVAGGSSSSDGTFVGTGYANTDNTAWIVKPLASASGEAFATCVAKRTTGLNFKWRSSFPYNGLASAQCRNGYILVSGFGTGTVKGSWFNSGTNTYWVSGGGTAHASCARSDAGVVVRHAWNKSQKPKTVFAGCGTGYSVLGGAMGDSAWPGPPIQEHPGDASGPSSHGYDGWWTFSSGANELTWAACVRIK